MAGLQDSAEDGAGGGEWERGVLISDCGLRLPAAGRDFGFREETSWIRKSLNRGRKIFS